MFEYAITSGEGTLIAYGFCKLVDVWTAVGLLQDGETMIARPCGPDCETGQ